jgi:hypothetical protein
VERVIETHEFGTHTVVVLEHVEDEGSTYSVLVDGCAATDPLRSAPGFDDIVRIYARSQQPQPRTGTHSAGH